VHATGYACALMKKTRTFVTAMMSFAFGFAFPAGASPLQAETELPMMPLSAHALKAGGRFPVDGGFQIEFEGHTAPDSCGRATVFWPTLAKPASFIGSPPSLRDKFPLTPALDIDNDLALAITSESRKIKPLVINHGTNG
jgi:hypothetical protein